MSNISLIELVKASQYLLSKIAQHPDFLALKYHPDLKLVMLKLHCLISKMS